MILELVVLTVILLIFSLIIDDQELVEIFENTE